ncbi:DUF2125 domain-containing protein [Phaeovulum sp. W22_SRMD_FR3]|uniref:DUF2125 domain-containing protein n=1 Tax=Phaeovulum sp. W22_SRMD_FR3 TaxID=3240274 RepID=UPI003F9D69DB
MVQWKSTVAIAALSAMLLPGAGAAAVTADEVWQSWVDYYTALGYEVNTASDKMMGDTLVLTDIDLSMVSEIGETNSEKVRTETKISIPEARMKEMGDGTVEVTLSNQMPMTSKTEVPDGDPINTEMMIAQQGLKMTASGEVGDISYAMKADEVAVEMTGFEAVETDVPAKMRFAMNGIVGTYTMASDDEAQSITSDMTAASADLTVSGADPEANSTINMTANAKDVKITSDMSLPEGLDMADFGPALEAGFAMSASLAYGASTMSANFDGAEGKGTMSSSGESGAFMMDLSSAGMTYDASAKGTKAELTTAQLPFPISFGLDDAAFKIAMPLSASEEPADMALVLKLAGLSLSDQIWGMFDPSGQLPHDPATLHVDLSGKAKLTANLFNPEEMTALESSPFEPQSATLNTLEVTAAGASLTGTGAATFDNSMGMPMPKGAVDLKLVGGNKLIDTLVAMALLPDEQAMGARMMLGLFAVPAGDDVLTSKIEMRDDGGLYANGQRLQ